MEVIFVGHFAHSQIIQIKVLLIQVHSEMVLYTLPIIVWALCHQARADGNRYISSDDFAQGIPKHSTKNTMHLWMYF